MARPSLGPWQSHGPFEEIAIGVLGRVAFNRGNHHGPKKIRMACPGIAEARR
jgi:hypothetical protein